MAISRRTTRTRYVVAVLVLAAITLVTIDAHGGNGGTLGGVRSATRTVVDPIEHAAHFVLRPVGNFFYGALHYGDVKQQNEKLRNELAANQAAAAQAAAAQQQSAAALQEQHLPFASNVPKVGAQVINEGSANFEASMQINKGSNQGVAVGDPVVAAAGLVGSVSQVSPTVSTILLVTDPTFSVGVTVDPNNVGDVATGAGMKNPMRVSGVNSSAVANPGEILTTSGLQYEAFPPGIPVGTVASVDAPAGQLQKSLNLTPLIHPGSLSVVQVLVWSPQTPPGS